LYFLKVNNIRKRKRGNLMKKDLILFLSVIFLFNAFTFGALAEDEIKVTVDGKQLTFDQPPIMENNRVLVPMRAIFEALNSQIDWDDATKTVTATKGDVVVKATIGQAEIIKNGTSIALDVAPVIVNGRTLVPVRAVSEALDAKVDWDQETKTVIITSAQADEDEITSGSLYKITSVSTGKNISIEGKSNDNGAKLFLTDANDEDYMVWMFVYNGDDYYTITNRKTNLVFDVPGQNKSPGVILTQYSSNNGDNQIFKLIKNEKGSYYLQGKQSGLYLTVNGSYISQENFTGNDDQCFTLTYVGESGLVLMGLAATPFVVKGEDAVSSIKLQWNQVPGATEYEVYQSKNGGEFELINVVKGTQLNVYDLAVGVTYKYQVKAKSKNKVIATATSKENTPYKVPENLNIYTNLTHSGFKWKTSGTLVDGTYYKFYTKGRTDGGSGFGSIVMQTSKDGINFGEEITVLTIEDVLAHPTSEGLKDCKFESNNFFYNPYTNKFMLWTHFEKASDYSLARLAVAYGTPGEKWTYGGSFRPLGYEARDKNIFMDDDGSAYIITATNMNSDIAIFKLNEEWTDVVELTAIVNKGQHREAPCITKVDGIYYMFTSGTAGWYPTRTMYNSAPSINGPWSEPKFIGNTSNFSSQSNYISKLGDTYFLNAYRWRFGWKDATDTSTHTRMFPISFADGFAFYDFYTEILNDTERQIAIRVENGRNLSQGKPAYASSNTNDAYKVNDGDYQTAWVANKEWPSSWTVDLEDVHELTELQISWHMVQGSEAYYNYTVEASLDGQNFEVILDKSQGYTDYGFTVDQLSGKARYIRINILDAKIQNTNSNWYTPQLYEVKVFGY